MTRALPRSHGFDLMNLPLKRHPLTGDGYMISLVCDERMLLTIAFNSLTPKPLVRQWHRSGHKTNMAMSTTQISCLTRSFQRWRPAFTADFKIYGQARKDPRWG